MSRFLVFVASISLAVLAISSTCVASPAQWSGVALRSSTIASTDDGFAIAWHSSELPSRTFGGGLLSL
jgi:hypothetical protein